MGEPNCCIPNVQPQIRIECLCYPNGRCCGPPFSKKMCEGRRRRHLRILREISSDQCIQGSTCLQVVEKESQRNYCADISESDINPGFDPTKSTRKDTSKSSDGDSNIIKEGKFPNNLDPLTLVLLAIGLGLALALLIFTCSLVIYSTRHQDEIHASGSFSPSGQGIAMTTMGKKAMPAIRRPTMAQAANLPKPPPNAAG